MWFLQTVSKFIRDEDGAVTVDWVVLTAAIAVIGSVILLTIESSLTNTSVEIASFIDSADDALT